MKIYLNSAKENWVVDRFIREWNEYNNFSKKSFLFNSQIVWIIAPWTWEKISKRFLNNKKVVCTIHHIDEDKFNKKELANFLYRDSYVDQYHVISKKTQEQVRKLTTKPITVIPFWLNKKIWFEIEDKDLIKKEYGISNDEFLVGSFQRDTEGYDLTSPKLSKGPDQFFEIVKYLNSQNENLKVILSGKRRNYLINKLKKEGIKFDYFEMVSFEELNKLYNILNLYIVASRYEGGPQSIPECALLGVPIISTDVGIASEILDSNAIFNMSTYSTATPNSKAAYNNVQKLITPTGFERFNKMFHDLNEI